MEETPLYSTVRPSETSEPGEGTSTLPFPCDYPGCNRTFATEQGKNVHKVRAHIKPWSTTGNFKGKTKKTYPSSDPEYRRRHYRKMVARNHAMGLNAHGEPFSSKGSQRMRKSQQLHRAKEKQQQLNGATSTIESDNMGDSARAIIMAAQVLRAVSLGMKL